MLFINMQNNRKSMATLAGYLTACLRSSDLVIFGDSAIKWICQRIFKSRHLIHSICQFTRNIQQTTILVTHLTLWFQDLPRFLLPPFFPPFFFVCTAPPAPAPSSLARNFSGRSLYSSPLSSFTV